MIRAEVVTESAARAPRADPVRRVVLCNVRQFNQAEVARWRSYLKQGGGVVIFGGDQVMADNYNRLLYRDGKGILPAAFGAEPWATPPKKEAHVQLQPPGLPASRSSPIFEASPTR